MKLEAERLACAVFLLSLFGYPLIGLLASALNAPSVLTSYPFRIAVAVCAALALFHARPLQSPNPIQWLLFAFFGAYLGRLLVSSGPGHVHELVFFFFASALPAIALSFTRADAQMLDRSIAFGVTALGGITVALAIAGEGFGLFGDLSLAYTGRLGTLQVNSVLLGHVAVSVILAWFAATYEGFANRAMSTGLIACALLALTLADARGPILALVGSAVSALVLVISKAKTSRLKDLRKALLGRAVVCLVGGVAAFFSPLQASPWFRDIVDRGQLTEQQRVILEYVPKSRAERQVLAENDPSIAERIIAVKQGASDFLSNPLYGTSSSGPYPHNLNIEAFARLGLMGGLVYIFLQLAALRAAVREFLKGRSMVSLLFVQALIGSSVSSSLYGAVQLWCTMALLLRNEVEAAVSENDV